MQNNEFQGFALYGRGLYHFSDSLALFSVTIFKDFLLFFYSNVRNCLDHLNSLPSPAPPQLPGRACSALFLILLKRRHKDNKEDKASKA
jgi:hypothetical protein